MALLRFGWIQMMPNITLMTLPTCPFGMRFQLLMQHHGIEYSLDPTQPATSLESDKKLYITPPAALSCIVQIAGIPLSRETLNSLSPLLALVDKITLGQQNLITAQTAANFENIWHVIGDSIGQLAAIKSDTPYFENDVIGIADFAITPFFLYQVAIDALYGHTLLDHHPNLSAWSAKLMHQQTIHTILRDGFPNQLIKLIENSDGYLSKLG